MPQSLSNPTATRAFLKKHFPQAAERFEGSLNTTFFYVQRRLTDAQQELIEREQPPDIYLMPEAGRYYPVPCAGPLVGITNIDNEGASGLELLYNAQLRGKPSTYALKRDARNMQRFYFERRLSEAGHEGTPLHTTIDRTIQFLAYEELQKTVEQFQATEGMALIMDPATGEIYAMVNYPDFDPNNVKNLIIEHTKNRCVTETYEFGSVIKIFLALAALAEGAVTLDTLLNCYNTKSMTLQGMKLTTVHPHGIIPFAEVIQGSNNIGTAQVALLLQDKIYDHYRRCGFGRATGIFPGEQAGYVTHPSSWSRQSLASLSYGYEIRATLLQLACAVSMIARGGKAVQPKIVMDDQRQPAPSMAADYDPVVINDLTTILERTVSHGTAQRARIKGYTVMGKTGTANLVVNLLKKQKGIDCTRHRLLRPCSNELLSDY